MTPLSTLATGKQPGRGRSVPRAPYAVRACSRPSAMRRWPAIALALLTLLAACGREPDLPPLPPASLDRSQSESLQRMNEAGASAFAGWTWRYEFGAGCRMRLIKRYEGSAIPAIEHVLIDHRVEKSRPDIGEV